MKTYTKDQIMKRNSAQPQALAMNGGTPVRSTPFAPWPHFDEEQIEAVNAVLRSGKANYWTGEEGRLFEREFAAAVDTEHAVTVANGTLALELALHALDIQPGDEVIVPCRTFIATATAVAVRGAIPIFADVDAVSGNVTADTIANVLTPRTKAVIVVHLAGWPCDMDPIMELAAEQGLKVIEDCAQAHGAFYKGRPAGSIGHIAAFSFCQDKIITTGGEGGMVTTNDKQLWDRAWSYKDHGKNWDAVYNREHETIFRWTHEALGTNWRMTEMQSAIGRVALRSLQRSVAIRRRHAAILDSGFGQNAAMGVPMPTAEFDHSYYKYYAYLQPDAILPKWPRDQIVRALQAEGIPCGSGICSEIYLEKTFETLGLQPADRLPVARQLAETSLMFMVHPTLCDADMQDVCAATTKVLAAVTAPMAASRSKAA